MPERITVQRMLAELEFPVASSAHREIRDAQADALDPLSELLHEVSMSRGGNGQQKAAVFHLLIRGVTELAAGAHLAEHCYVAQAYSVMRPVLDGCDLIELFARDPSEAKLWTETNEAHKHFAPSRVRRRLGVGAYDGIHGHFSEQGSHPRFAGMRASGAMRVARDDPDDRTAVFRLGPTWTTDPATFIVALFASDVTVKLGFKARHLGPFTDDPAATRRQWLRRYRDSIAAVLRVCDLALAKLDPLEPTDDDLRGPYRELHAKLSEWLGTPESVDE